MNDKEKAILREIVNYYKKNNYMPTIRELTRLMNYKSTNSIYQYLLCLERKGYLKRDNERGKLSLVDIKVESNIVNLKVINENKAIIFMGKNKKCYKCFKMNNEYFNHLFIRKDDYLIIENTKELNNQDLGLFIVNKKYRIMEYMYLDGFYILKDNTQEILYRVNIIGKVVGIYREY